MIASRSRTTPGKTLGTFLVGVIMIECACGPQDYQKPIQQFQDASTVVSAAAHSFLQNANTIEQDKMLDDIVFRMSPLDLPALDQVGLYTSDEIHVRVRALEILSAYSSNLAELASGKAQSALGDSTKSLSDALSSLGQDAKKLPDKDLKNSTFGSTASAAASAIGAVAQLLIARKSRREIEHSIVDNDAAVTTLIQRISEDMQGAYLRQEDQIGLYGDQLSRDYQIEIRRNPDPVLLLSLAKTIKAYRAQKALLPDANPAPSIEKMKTAHGALVDYVKSNKTPKSFAQLIASVQAFVDAARPLGEAVQSLVSTR